MAGSASFLTMESIRAYRYFSLSEAGHLRGMVGHIWGANNLAARCPHTPELAECLCGIYGLYSPISAYSGHPVLASCLFYGRTVIATEGVRSTKADIETIWLISDSLHRAYGSMLSAETTSRIQEEIAYHLSARYGVAVTVIAKEHLPELPVSRVRTDIPRTNVLGYFRDGDATTKDAPAFDSYGLTLKQRSRLARSLAHAVENEDGVVRAAELRGLHCKEWRDCIHGVSGYATFIDNIVAWGVFERVKRGSYRITDLGRRLLAEGRLEVKRNPRFSNPGLSLKGRFIPIEEIEGSSIEEIEGGS